MSAFRSFQEEAYHVLGDSRWPQALAMDDGEKERYGDNDVGRGCLLARNLVTADAGTRYVHVKHGGWDHHKRIYDHSARSNHYKHCNDLDRALSNLLLDLEGTPSPRDPAKTLLDETIVAVPHRVRASSRSAQLSGRPTPLQRGLHRSVCRRRRQGRTGHWADGRGWGACLGDRVEVLDAAEDREHRGVRCTPLWASTGARRSPTRRLGGPIAWWTPLALPSPALTTKSRNSSSDDAASGGLAGLAGRRRAAMGFRRDRARPFAGPSRRHGGDPGGRVHHGADVLDIRRRFRYASAHSPRRPPSPHRAPRRVLDGL